MKIKILGVCGSPVKGGNTELFLEEALKAAREIRDVETEAVLLSQKDINDCQHCNWCLRGQGEGQFCKQKDDMSEIYPLLLEADGLLLASPVYISRLSGRLASFLDRLRVFVFGNYYRGMLKDKVGGSLAVGWSRHGGLETTLLSINYAFWQMGMLHAPEHGRFLGATGVTGPSGSGEFTPSDRHQVLKDEFGLNSARQLAKRVVELIEIIKLGKAAREANHAQTSNTRSAL
jgi:multimeric flavodoxin WrbA